MSDYICVIPPEAHSITPNLASFERSGKDGNEVVVPVFGGDNFVGEVLGGKWKKYTDGDILGFIARLTSGHLELTGKSHAAGTSEYGFVTSNSKMLLNDGTTLIFELECPAVVTSPRHVGVEVDLVAVYAEGDDPQDENDWLKIQLQNDDGTYEFRVRKSVGGSESDVVAWTGVTNPNVVFKLVFNEDGNGSTSIYVDDGESGTFAEVTSSPFELALNFTEAYVVCCLETNDATVRTCLSDYITVSYPNFDVKYELPLAKQGVESLFTDAKDETLQNGADTAVVDDSSSGTCARLNAQNEGVRYSFSSLSKGRYLALIRVKDTAQVANDVVIQIRNGATYIDVTGTFHQETCEGTFKVLQYMFDVSESDVGDTLDVNVYKGNATANTIYVDWFRIIPYHEKLGSTKCFDTIGEASEDDWQQVFDEDHVFVGDVVIENGLIRLWIDNGVIYGIKPYVWLNNSWVLFADRQFSYLQNYAKILKYPFFLQVIQVTSEQTIIKLRLEDTATQDSDYYLDYEITLFRGKYYFSIKPLTVFPIDNFGIRFYNASAYRLGYVGNAETVKIGDDDINVDTYNSTQTDNFLLSCDNDGPSHMLFLASNHKPTNFIAVGSGSAYIRMSYFAPSTINSLKYFIGVVPFSRVASLFAEAEDETLTGGASTSDEADDSGESAELGAQNESVTWNLDPINNNLPEGRYLALFRIKDSNQIADDVGVQVYNDDDSTFLNQENVKVTKTVTAAWAYYQLVFDVDSDDLGDSVSISVNKEEADANTILVDYFLIIPIGNGESLPQDIAHNAMRKIGLHRKTFRR